MEQVNAGGAHVLDADDGAGLHRFEAGFEQQLLHERIAHLDIGALLLRALLEFLAGHGGAMNPVAAGLCAYIYDRVTGPRSLAIEDFVFAHHAERERVHQRIPAVAGLKLRLAAEVWHPEAVAVGGNAADHTFHNGVILRDQFWMRAGLGRDGPEAQRIHHRQRPRAHGEDVAQDAAHARSRALERLDVAGVVMALDLERAGPAVPHVDDACVFARPLDHAIAFGRQAFQMDAA